MSKSAKIILSLAIILLFLATITFLLVFSSKSTISQPIVSKEFPIQGLTARTISYYDQPGLYPALYNTKDNQRLIKKAKEAGANYLLVRIFYNGTPEGKLIGDNQQAKEVLSKFINQAHQQGFQIFLTPYVESRDYWVTKEWKLDQDLWTQTVLEWAKFAQQHQVAMFAPGVEMSIILDQDQVGDWLKAILPQIRQVYSGKVITAEHYDIERWKILDQAGSFTGYDCLGLTMFPRKEYQGVSDMRNFEDFTKYINQQVTVTNQLAEKYQIDCKLAVPFGLDFWHGTEPSGEILAQAYQIGLDILNKNNFTGVFLSHWASEHDHLGADQTVEQMLAKRWND